MKYFFPFGQQLHKVRQQDRTPKQAFILGVYTSAVHARWVGVNGKQKVGALAVASEPEIFWRGENAEEIIASIEIPKEFGKLTPPTNPELNGPSGRTLDELYLKPLGLNRENTWLCDLLPESRVNPNQKKAIEKYYNPEIIEKYGLPKPTIPDFNKNDLDSPTRRQEILAELEASKARTLILLGDLPIYWFLRFFDERYTKLSDMIDNDNPYGMSRKVIINNKIYDVIALCHPRQAGGLGGSSPKWRELHESWVRVRKQGYFYNEIV